MSPEEIKAAHDKINQHRNDAFSHIRCGQTSLACAAISAITIERFDLALDLISLATKIQSINSSVPVGQYVYREKVQVSDKGRTHV